MPIPINDDGTFPYLRDDRGEPYLDPAIESELTGGGSISATDGTVTVNPATSIQFPGSNLEDGGSGVAIFGPDGDVTFNSLHLNPDAARPTGVLAVQAHVDQATKVVAVEVAGAEVLQINEVGSLRVSPGGTEWLMVTPSDVTLGGANGIYLDATTTSFFGSGGAGQSPAITDATDAATTMARLNTLLAYLRSLGLIAS